jgi:hypothetical protein
MVRADFGQVDRLAKEFGGVAGVAQKIDADVQSMFPSDFATCAYSILIAQRQCAYNL